MSKVLLLFLGLAVILALIYLGSSRFSGDKISLGNAVQSGKTSAAASGKVLGAEAIKGALSGVDSLIAKTEGIIKNGAAGLVKNVSESATKQITEAILGSSTSPAPQIANTTGTLGVASVCPSYPKNQAVSFILKFSSASPDQAYSVDWGDGRNLNGKTSAPEISFSHSYSTPGNYTVAFKAGTLESKKDICVE